jgi:hypothetical protein
MRPLRQWLILAGLLASLRVETTLTLGSRKLRR